MEEEDKYGESKGDWIGGCIGRKGRRFHEGRRKLAVGTIGLGRLTDNVLVAEGKLLMKIGIPLTVQLLRVTLVE